MNNQPNISKSLNLNSQSAATERPVIAGQSTAAGQPKAVKRRRKWDMPISEKAYHKISDKGMLLLGDFGVGTRSWLFSLMQYIDLYILHGMCPTRGECDFYLIAAFHCLKYDVDAARERSEAARRHAAARRERKETERKEIERKAAEAASKTGTGLPADATGADTPTPHPAKPDRPVENVRVSPCDCVKSEPDRETDALGREAQSR